MTLPHRKELWFLFVVPAFAAIVLAVIVMLRSPTLTWYYLPFARGIHHATVLNDSSLLGMNTKNVADKLGSPSSVSGPYSWWWLGPGVSDVSSMMFHYDDSLNVVRINMPDIRDGYSRDSLSVPIDLHLWQQADPETRHRMNIDLVRRSEAGDIPSALKTLTDVEQYFPDAKFVHNWSYTTGMLLSVAMSFDRNGNVIDVWEGND